VKAAVFVLVALLSTGCAKDIQNSDSVKQAVMDHLKSRSDFGLNLDAMDIRVSSVRFGEGTADAEVAFVPKGGSPEAGMSMNYKLTREDDKWVIKSKGMSGPVGGGNTPQLPPGHVPVPAPGNTSQGK
jgi:hypothetical protein